MPKLKPTKALGAAALTHQAAMRARALTITPEEVRMRGYGHLSARRTQVQHVIAKRTVVFTVPHVAPPARPAEAPKALGTYPKGGSK